MKKDLIEFIDGIIEIPYELNGRDPEKGLDCLGLVLHLYRDFLKVDLFDDTQVVPPGWENDPQYSTYMEDLLKEHGRFIKEPRPFDIVLMAPKEHFFANHMGIYLEDGTVLNTHEWSGVHRVSLATLIDRHKVKGFVRMKELDGRN